MIMLIIKIIKQFKGLRIILKNYGITLCVLTVLVRFTRLKYFVNLRHKYILNYLENCYSNKINIQDAECDYKPKCKIIWTMWWQDERPEIIELCLKSMERNIPNYKVIVISKENFKNYISLPAYILKKFDDGMITITHLSDIIRFKLLRKYGSFWFDSTNFFKNKINVDELLRNGELAYWTPKFHYKFCMCISNYRWHGYALYMNRNYILARFIDDFFMEYWKNEKALIDYWLIDYVTDIAVRHIPKYCNDWGKLQYNDNMFCKFNIFNKEYDEKSYEAYSGDIFKLQRRDRFVNFKNGKETVLGHLLKEFDLL